MPLTARPTRLRPLTRRVDGASRFSLHLRRDGSFASALSRASRRSTGVAVLFEERRLVSWKRSTLLGLHSSKRFLTVRAKCLHGRQLHIRRSVIVVGLKTDWMARANARFDALPRHCSRADNVVFGANAYIGGIVSARLVVLVLLQDDTVFEVREFARMKTLRGNTCLRPAQ